MDEGLFCMMDLFLAAGQWCGSYSSLCSCPCSDSCSLPSTPSASSAPSAPSIVSSTHLANLLDISTTRLFDYQPPFWLCRPNQQQPDRIVPPHTHLQGFPLHNYDNALSHPHSLKTTWPTAVLSITTSRLSNLPVSSPLSPLFSLQDFPLHHPSPKILYTTNTNTDIIVTNAMHIDSQHADHSLSDFSAPHLEIKSLDIPGKAHVRSSATALPFPAPAPAPAQLR